MPSVHMTLQGKGGVGKSMIAAILGQYVLEQGQPLLAIDTDPVNATLSSFKALNARSIELLQGSQINPAAFDEMVEMTLDDEADVVVDNGASSFIPLSNYMIENPAVATLEAHGRTIIIHSVITGGSALLETLDGFRQVAAALPTSVKIVVWLNELFGPIKDGERTFTDMRTYQEVKPRISGIIIVLVLTAPVWGAVFRLGG